MTTTSRRENSELMVGQPQALDLFIPAGILLDESVRARDIGFGLVIIEVTDEIFDRIIRKKAFELGVKLGGERFVVRNDQRRFVDVFDNIRNGKRLARAGDSKKHLMPASGYETVRSASQWLAADHRQVHRERQDQTWTIRLR